MSDCPQTVLPVHNPERTGSTLFQLGRVGSGEALVLLALGVCWLLFFNELRGEWQINPQYSYGYVVPLLGAALLWRRWPDRPAAIPGASPLMVVALFVLVRWLQSRGVEFCPALPLGRPAMDPAFRSGVGIHAYRRALADAMGT